MKCLLLRVFNMDIACVELEYFNGSMISIDTIAAEYELDVTMLH